MIVSISPHIITQNIIKVKSFFEKCLKNINLWRQKMLERSEKKSKKEIFLQKNQKINNQKDKQWFCLD